MAVTREENEALTRTGAQAPMGRLVRRYWLPALLSEEIPEPDSPPVQVRMLGEELVAFRDSRGRIGLLQEGCMHRGTSLFYGRNEESGLRCIYHGWKYNVEGRVLDTPAEPAGSRFKEKLCHTAYPTQEVNGIIFAYLGPTEKMPQFPAYEWATVPPSHAYVTKNLLECNYLQGLEGECDNAHTSFLHSQFGDGPNILGQTFTDTDRAPRYDIEETAFGLRLACLRNAGPGRTYVRITTFLMPLSCAIAQAARLPDGSLDGYEVHFYTPIDDTHAWRYDFGFRRSGPIVERATDRRDEIGPDYRRHQRADNHYLQNREWQRRQDFTGIDGFLAEDACATESAGSIVDRSREHLGVSDVGVIALRRYLLDALDTHEGAREPPHLVTDPAGNHFPDAGSTAAVIEGDWHKLVGV